MSTLSVTSNLKGCAGWHCNSAALEEEKCKNCGALFCAAHHLWHLCYSPPEQIATHSFRVIRPGNNLASKVSDSTLKKGQS